MNINELDNYQLSDAIRFHDRLNPRLWDEREQLRPEVRERLLAIAQDFQEFLGVSDLNLEDITISGSNAAYSYTPHSDIDLHLIVRMPEQCDEVYRELFNAKKYQYNDLHDIRIRGADVELYVQPSDEPVVSLGEYSILRDQWIQVPRRQRAKIDHSLVRHKYEDVQARIESALKENDADRIQALVDKIKLMRKTGLDQHGEFGPENLVFKMLRTQGWIKQLYDRLAAARDQELSLMEKQRQQKRQRWGFAQWIGEPGSEAAMEDDTGEIQGSTTGDAGAQSTWDGVSPDTQEFLNETSAPPVLERFIQMVAQRLGIENMPRVNIHDSPQWSETNHSFGRYDPKDHELHVSLPGRHILDVMRTTAHELAHCRQHEIEPLPDSAGATGSDWENEAHAVAGIIMRDFADANPSYFEQGNVQEDQDDVNSLKWPGEPIPFPKGTVKVGVSDVYDWYKLGQQISDLDDANPQDFGQGAPQTVLSFGSEPIEHRYIQDLKRLNMPTQDIDEGLDQLPQITRRAIAAACVAAGVSGCGTVGQTLNTTRDVARLATQIERAGRAGMQEELAQELKNYARARGGDATAQNQSILYQKERELREGGWDDPVTQATVIRPSTVRAALETMQRFVREFNAWLERRGHVTIALGHPTGSSAYHGQDPESKIYGDIDLQIVVPEVPETQGKTTSQRQAYWNRLADEWVREQRPAYVHVNSRPGHPLIAVGPDAWVQVDLMAHAQPLAQWGRYRVTPERGTKGLLYGNMFSVLGDLLGLSIQHAGVQYKERNGERLPFARTLKNYQLRTISTQIDHFVREIFDHEYQAITGQDPSTAKVDPALAQNPGVDLDNPNIARLARAIQGLARSFELNGMYGQGSLQNYQSADQFVQTFLDRYTAKSAEAAGAAKFDKAVTPAAQARAQSDREAIAQGTQRVVDLLREASGYIPTEAESNDPRFLMALTQDVRPGEVGRQANKLALQTDSQGRPALLRESQQLAEIRMNPASLRREAATTGARAGMEFEMVVPGVFVEDEDRSGEPDYDQDRRPTSINDIHDFFYDGNWNSRRDVDRATDDLRERYEQARDEITREDFQDEALELIQRAIREDISEEEVIQDLLMVEYDAPKVREILDAVRRGDRDSDLYQLYSQAQARADEEFESRAERSYEDEDEYWDQAWDKFTKNHEPLEEDDWLWNEQIRSMQDVQSEYDQWLSWPYYTEPNSDGLETIEDVANDFGRVVPSGAEASSEYHGQSRGNRYIVEPDGSINVGRDEAGLEFVSPPLPVDDLMDDLDRIVAWARRNGCYTNDSTGLHINVSVPGLDTNNLDYIKLAVLLGDEHVLETFGRLGNAYTRSAMRKIRNRVPSDPQELQKYFDLVRQGLAQEASRLIHGPITEKYTSINVREGWIEFRSPGGDWLNMDLDQIKNTLLRFVVALAAAVDPNKYRQEYLKKFSQLMSGDSKQVRYYDPRDPRNAKEPVVFVDRPAPGLRQVVGASDFDQSAVDIFVQWSTGNLPQTALKSFVRNLQARRQTQKKVPAQTSGGKHYEIIDRDRHQRMFTFQAQNEQQATEQYLDWLVSQGYPRQITQDYGWREIEPSPEATTPAPATAAGGDWTGRWHIVAPPGMILHTIGGVGNVAASALEVARRWVEQNPVPYGVDPSTIRVQPEMRNTQS